MATHPQHGNIGGTTYHVGDAYVWSAIYYLDSPTDFREYLPVGKVRKLKCASKLVLGLALMIFVVVAGVAIISRALIFG